MRKLSVISAFLTLFLVLLALPSIAWATIYDWSVGVEIDPADAFDKSKMVRTFTYDGVEYDDLSVVYATNNKFRLVWFSDYFIPEMQVRAQRDLSEGLVPSPVDIEFVEVNKELFVEAFCISAWQYPCWDIVSINGEPWQHSAYRDVIIKRVGEIVKPSEPLGDRNSDAWAMFMDPRTNGASHVWFGDPKDPNYKGGPLSAVTDYTVDRITKYNPLNNGKPFDFNSWKNPNSRDSLENNHKEEISKEETSAQGLVKTEVFPNPEWRQGAVLFVGNPRVTIINNGATKVNILSTAPEVIRGRTMIPLRGVLDELGYELEYDGEKEQISLNGQEQNIVLTIGSKTALVNGNEIELDQPAIIKGGRTLVPLRFVSENVGFSIQYDNGTITINK